MLYIQKLIFLNAYKIGIPIEALNILPVPKAQFRRQNSSWSKHGFNQLATTIKSTCD